MTAQLKVSNDHVQATGGRKASSARVFLWPGKGRMEINKKQAQDYFKESGEIWKRAATEPLDILGVAEDFDLYITVKGGGISGQAGAIRLAIARALDKYEQLGKAKPASKQSDDQESGEDDTWHTKLKRKACLSRDSRAVERKKAGQPGARKKKQFSKR